MVIDDVVRDIKAKHPREIFVIGHTDRTGSATYNASLSKRRARAVAGYLRQALAPERYFIRVEWHGEFDLPYPTRDGVPEPLNRCVGLSTTPLLPLEIRNADNRN